MSALPDNGLQGLDGWGKSLKKAVHQAIAVPKALAIPTSKNIKAAAGSLKTAAPVAASIAAVTVGLPMLASTAASLTSVAVDKVGGSNPTPSAPSQYFDASGNPISEADYNAAMAQITGTAPAAPVGAAAPMTTSAAASPATASQDPAAAKSGSGWATAGKWAAGIFLGVKFLGVLI